MSSNNHLVLLAANPYKKIPSANRLKLISIPFNPPKNSRIFWCWAKYFCECSVRQTTCWELENSNSLRALAIFLVFYQASVTSRSRFLSTPRKRFAQTSLWQTFRPKRTDSDRPITLLSAAHTHMYVNLITRRSESAGATQRPQRVKWSSECAAGTLGNLRLIWSGWMRRRAYFLPTVCTSLCVRLVLLLCRPACGSQQNSSDSLSAQ